MTYHDLFDSKEGAKCQMALDFLDGNQAEWMTKVMNDPQKGRKKWKDKGMIVRFRNITNMIVEKSGMLFIDSEPEIELYNEERLEDQSEDRVNEPASIKLKNLMDKSDWVENFINIDNATRLLKTTLVLVQYDPINQKLFFDTLHRGNSAVLIDNVTREINTLVYKLGDLEDGSETLRVITNDLIQDYSYNVKTNIETLINEVPNQLGMIPVTPFHDTRIPRCEFWNPCGYDLIQLNEIYNLHLIDSEWTASWSKLKTLYTNADIRSNDTEDKMELAEIAGRPFPVQVPSQGGIGAGPGSVIKIDGYGDTPFLQYLGPEVDLQPIDEMFNRWIRDFASDWSVNVKSGSGTASSGFQLVVEEIDNLQLRQRRQKMFIAGMRRMYKIIAALTGLDPDLELYVTFKQPKLPVDGKAREEEWNLKIEGNRASIIDYLMDTKSLTREEAITEYKQILEDKKLGEEVEPVEPIMSESNTIVSNDINNNDGTVDPINNLEE